MRLAGVFGSCDPFSLQMNKRLGSRDPFLERLSFVQVHYLLYWLIDREEKKGSYYGKQPIL